MNISFLFALSRDQVFDTNTTATTLLPSFYSLFREIRSSTSKHLSWRLHHPGLVSIRSFARSGLRPRHWISGRRPTSGFYSLFREIRSSTTTATATATASHDNPIPKKFLFALSRDQVFDERYSHRRAGRLSVSIRSFARSGLRPATEPPSRSVSRRFYSLFREIRSSTPWSRRRPGPSSRPFLFALSRDQVFDKGVVKAPSMEGFYSLFREIRSSTIYHSQRQE